MCTMTWWRGSDDCYCILFNRDEKKTRAPGRAPQVELISETRCILPRDPDGGGTWLLCNEHGLTVAILNAYQVEVNRLSEEFESRGRIPLNFAAARSVDEVAERVSSLDSAPYRPFTLIAIDRQHESVWEPGQRRELAHSLSVIQQPVVSSSFRSEYVLPERRRLYSERQPDAAGLRAFHRLGLAAPNAVTPAMNRPDAQTVSICELSVSKERLKCRYEAMPRDLIGESKVTECSLVF